MKTERKIRTAFPLIAGLERIFEEIDMERGEGETMQQIRTAPKGAVFIWCNGRTEYPRELAQKIGRWDLQIQSPAWLEDRWRGLKLTGVVVDHAARLTDRQLVGFQGALTRVRSNVK